MGPCRITPNVQTGVCVIDAAGMVMRNLVHLNMLGTEAYTYHAIEAAKTLKATAEGRTPFEINRKIDYIPLTTLSGSGSSAPAMKNSPRIMLNTAVNTARYL